jgi:ParB-like chromosome segregation protein Spo0J
MAEKSSAKKRAKVSRDQLLKPRETKTTPKTTTSLDKAKLSRIKVIPVPLSRIVLDRYQPRPILPVQDGLRDNFFAGKSDWRKTADAWLALAKSDAGIKDQVNELLDMGISISELNQIEPASGAWVEKIPGEIRMLLSTGERRFWSLALLAASNKGGEPQLEVQEIDIEDLNLARQIIENESAKPLSAIGKARAIAGLILEQIDRLPPELDLNSDNPPTDYDYYQSVLDLEKITGNKQMPRGLWEMVGEIMGMERSYMVFHLNLLKFPQNLQYKAETNELTEGVLREILTFPPAEWARVMNRAIKNELTAPQVKQIGKSKGKKPKIDSPPTKAASRLRAFWKITREIKTAKDIEQVATDFSAGLEKKEILDGANLLEKLAAKLRLRAEG